MGYLHFALLHQGLHRHITITFTTSPLSSTGYSPLHHHSTHHISTGLATMFATARHTGALALRGTSATMLQALDKH